MEQLSDNRKKIREAFRSGQINAICGYPGNGMNIRVMSVVRFATPEEPPIGRCVNTVG